MMIEALISVLVFGYIGYLLFNMLHNKGWLYKR
jgi:hypothetical protein